MMTLATRLRVARGVRRRERHNDWLRRWRFAGAVVKAQRDFSDALAIYGTVAWTTDKYGLPRIVPLVEQNAEVRL